MGKRNLDTCPTTHKNKFQIAMSQTEDNMNKIFIFISWNSKRLLLSKTKKNLEHNKKITNLTIKIYSNFFPHSII